MPNWCMNELTVTGPTEEIKRFVYSNLGLPAHYPPVYSKDGKVIIDSPVATTPYFCFNAQVPTPKEVLEIGYDGHDKISRFNQKYAYHGHTIFPIDGYHWNIANWGTKWDIYSDKITPKDMGWQAGAEKIFLGFDTAWSPPTAWLKAIAELFPIFSFKLHYEEPGCYFAGDLYAEEGVCWDDSYDDYRCRQIFACNEDNLEDEAVDTSAM